MSSSGDSPNDQDSVLHALKERAKELECLYAVEKHLRDPSAELGQVFLQVTQAIPPGFQFPEVCRARLCYGGSVWAPPDFAETPWVLRADIQVLDQVVGAIEVCYLRQMPASDVGPFLKEEAHLMHTVADRIGHFVQLRNLRNLFEQTRGGATTNGDSRDHEWRAVVRLLRRTDQALYARIARKILNHLCWSGVREAQAVVQKVGEEPVGEGDSGLANMPSQKRGLDSHFFLSEEPFEIAARYLSDEEMLARVQSFVFEDRIGFLLKTLGRQQSSLPEIADAIRRYQQINPEGVEISRATMSGIKVALIRRFLTEQLDFINVAKKYVQVSDFLSLVDRMILLPGSHGTVGGKAAGLFLATQIIKRTQGPLERSGLKVPRSWYVVSDALLDFMRYNDFDEVMEQKYKRIDEVRREYPHVVQMFKNGAFPPEVVHGLSAALDDFGDVPLVVRSSSRLEDRLGTAFSGKYKSLFLANQGGKPQRMAALLDAIAEIYASTFGPDPIEYRSVHGLLDFDEEMGILIQEVVGARCGRYWLPSYAGVAFSRNEFRWSPRIKRDDGLLRIVPGLGTRAVDRMSDDYPVLIAPGQPHLRANVSLDEVIRYSPKRADVINLERRTFESVDLAEVIKQPGAEYPGFSQVFSVTRGEQLGRAVGILLDPEKDELLATFDGLRDETPFVAQMGRLLKLLQDSLGTPVDLEFASDGKDLFVLQCRPQSQSADSTPSPIPQDAPKEDVIFSARRYVSSGVVPDITHIVYVDPEKYAALATQQELLAVGRAVGRLNKLLPKRQFILMGPGRWGSRGDIKMGVKITYSDINNTAVLVEIARKRGGYLPDLSFGTHFFQDLVESSIRYLPLYPDDDGVLFNEHFLTGSHNILASILPEFEGLADTVRVIDVPASAKGMVLRVLLNGDLDQALGLLAPAASSGPRGALERTPVARLEDHWRWRLQMAERIAAELDPERFGVQAFYVFGSTKNATAGPGSDIDLLIHIRGTAEQETALRNWLEGWSRCLAEMNWLRTGYRTDRLLDVHLVTDQDIAARTSFAVKIGAVTDAARPLPLKARQAQ